MRWVEKQTTKPELAVGDTRTITKFLFFPMKIGKETRWLETASINQEVKPRVQIIIGLGDIHYCNYIDWTNISWAE